MPFAQSLYAILLIFGLMGAFFLFWRACRHDFIDATDALDLAFAGAIGAAIGARVGAFLINYEQFEWSLERLLFFNVYGGFSYYGALAGLFAAMALGARAKKLKTLAILDLLAPPLVFLQAANALGKYFSAVSIFAHIWLIYAFGMLVIFWFLKRLGKRKRHDGFFISFYLVFSSILEVFIFWFRDDVLFAFGIPYQLVVPLVILQATLITWYVASKRNFLRDLKNFFAIFLLSVLRVKRMVVDANEAGKFSRSLILGPIWFVREAAKLLKWIAVEIIAGFVDLLSVFGVRR